jgi:cytochrome P450 family 150 subfamily A5
MSDYDAIDFFRGHEFGADPYEYFDWLRAQCPVRRERHHGVMMVTGVAVVRSAARRFR